MQNALADGLIRKLWIAEVRPSTAITCSGSTVTAATAGSAARCRTISSATTSMRPTGSTPWCTAFSSTACCAAPPNCGRSARRSTREAEAALSIETPWQSHGVGSELLDRTLLAARNRGIKTLHMACLANNRRMQELARKFAAELSFDFGSVVGEVAAARPTPLSVLREFVADGHGFATAVLDVQSRLLRPV